MNTVYLLLGSNLDDRARLIRHAIAEISMRIGDVIKASSMYESEPWGFNDDHLFLNQVIRVETRLQPKELLNRILQIENELGRKRAKEPGTYASRKIDIDILFYNEAVIRDEHLAIPHPKMAERMFTLMPMCEINESFIHPVFHKTVKELKAECPDPCEVFLYHS
jgi:2-amino-4-hydroxy-6-hydroxymethyldihydropteridine diphosphokinase